MYDFDVVEPVVEMLRMREMGTVMLVAETLEFVCSSGKSCC